MAFRDFPRIADRVIELSKPRKLCPWDVAAVLSDKRIPKHLAMKAINKASSADGEVGFLAVKLVREKEDRRAKS